MTCPTCHDTGLHVYLDDATPYAPTPRMLEMQKHCLCAAGMTILARDADDEAAFMAKQIAARDWADANMSKEKGNDYDHHD